MKRSTEDRIIFIQISVEEKQDSRVFIWFGSSDIKLN